MATIAEQYHGAQIASRRIKALIETIQQELMNNPAIKDALNQCDLEPTSRAAYLAGGAAVNVLLAHELGQEVARDQLGGECDYPGCTQPALDDDVLCAEHRQHISEFVNSASTNSAQPG